VAFALLAFCSVQSTAPPTPQNQPAPSHVEGSQGQGSQVKGPGATGSPPAAEAALIRNSGSTNTQPYTIAVKPDGSAVVVVGSGAPEERRLPPAQTAALFEQLRAAAPLDALAHGHCMRSASFGTTTTVTFGGVTTPDLSCAPGPGTRALADTVAALVAGLRLSVMRVYRPPPQ
jgi:hypothetical protein